MHQTRMIAFDCPACREQLEIGERAAGKEVRCVECGVPMTVPMWNQVPDQPLPMPPTNSKTVPVRFGLPKVGQFETHVTKKDASRMGHTFLGGMIALMGVIVCAVLGINFSKRS